MFGQNNHDQQQSDQIPDQAIDAAMQDDNQQVPSAPPVPPQDVPADNNNWGHPGTPMDNSQPQTFTPLDHSFAAPQPDEVAAPTPVDTPVEPASSDVPQDSPVSSDLIDIKQKALSQLTPLVGHLDQAPEDKFRTTMMMIQASDDQSLLNSAYEAANQIADEKLKAQALLDIVNEINYFTQPKA